MKVGDRVKVKHICHMPHPQCLYQGQTGSIIHVGAYIKVSPDNPLSGADKVSGIPYVDCELELIE